jgi:NADP-dependent 3-hydroxy acid dehydrogenase YdfG
MSNWLQLANKTVIITGAASDIGAELVTALQPQGFCYFPTYTQTLQILIMPNNLGSVLRLQTFSQRHTNSREWFKQIDSPRFIIYSSLPYSSTQLE